VSAPLNGQQKATNRVSAQYLSSLAKLLRRCGDINPLTGDVCVTQVHDDDVEHMAVQIGGPRDGHVYATWGGRRVNKDTGLTTNRKHKG
jgi:hypothetical protein